MNIVGCAQGAGDSLRKLCIPGSCLVRSTLRKFGLKLQQLCLARAHMRLSTGEIGVPPYFAKRLSFPERVTPLNVEQLRAAVIAGAEQHPGAVAVEEISSGRMISLANVPLQVCYLFIHASSQNRLQTFIAMQPPDSMHVVLLASDSFLCNRLRSGGRPWLSSFCLTLQSWAGRRPSRLLDGCRPFSNVVAAPWRSVAAPHCRATISYTATFEMVT